MATKKSVTKKPAVTPKGAAQNIIDRLAPKSLKDGMVRAIKLFFFVFIPLIPANNFITDADPAIIKTAAVAGVSAVFAFVANTIFTWASSYDFKE